MNDMNSVESDITCWRHPCASGDERWLRTVRCNAGLRRALRWHFRARAHRAPASSRPTVASPTTDVRERAASPYPRAWGSAISTTMRTSHDAAAECRSGAAARGATLHTVVRTLRPIFAKAPRSTSQRASSC